MKKIIYLLVLTLTFFCCQENNDTKKQSKWQSDKTVDFLPSWNDGHIKNSIIKYVEEITDSTSSNYIPVRDRIATFDNDGTLMSEKPIYFQFYFALDKLKDDANKDSSLKEQDPYKTILNNDLKAVLSMGKKELIDIVMKSHSEVEVADFQKNAITWFENAEHPTKNRLYKDLNYQPMLELINLLKQNNFEVFIVSGGGIDFVRSFSEEQYGIPKQNVIGSSLDAVYSYNDGNPKILKTSNLDLIDDHKGKPEGINRYIGRKPVFAVGNSDGDLDMMRWTDSNKHKTIKLFLHHTDSIREWSYDRNSKVGTFDKALDEAIEKSWLVIDMQKDWKVIFPFENI